MHYLQSCGKSVGQVSQSGMQFVPANFKPGTSRYHDWLTNAQSLNFMWFFIIQFAPCYLEQLASKCSVASPKLVEVAVCRK